MLFETVTSKADIKGRKCYLESSRDEPNIAIYERLGFRKVKEMDCDDDGTICRVSLSSQQLAKVCIDPNQLFCMIRDPQPVIATYTGQVSGG